MEGKKVKKNSKVAGDNQKNNSKSNCVNKPGLDAVESKENDTEKMAMNEYSQNHKQTNNEATCKKGKNMKEVKADKSKKGKWLANVTLTNKKCQTHLY